MQLRWTTNSQKILGTEEQSWGLHTSWHQNIKPEKQIKTAFYCHEFIQIDHWNGLENPEINPYICCQMILQKGIKISEWGKDNIFNKYVEKMGCVHTQSFSCVCLFVTMDCSPLGSSVHGFPRQEYWSGLPFPLPGVLPDPGMEPMSPALAARFFTIEPSGKP